MKKIFYIITVTLMVLISLTGCNTKTEEKSTAAVIEELGHQNVTLNIIHWNRLPQNIIDKFEEENPGIKIYFEQYPVDKFIDVIEAKIAAKEVPDILGTQEVNFQQYVKQGIYMDLTDEDFISNYMDEAVEELKAFSEDGRVYSVPTNAFSLGIWINKDIFVNNDIAIPTDTTELLRAAEELRGLGITPFVQGVKDGWPIIQTLFPMFDVQAANEGIYDMVKTGEKKWSEGPIRNGFIKWAEIFAKDGMLTDDSMDLTYEQAYQSFEQGKAAMWPMGSWATHFLKDNNGKMKELPFQIAYIPIYSADHSGEKVIPGTYIGAMYSISATTKKPTEAKKFIEFITRPENAVEFSKGSGVIMPMKNIEERNLPPFVSVAYKTTLKNKLVRPFNMTMDEAVSDQLVAALQNIASGKQVDEELDKIQKVQDSVNLRRK